MSTSETMLSIVQIPSMRTCSLIIFSIPLLRTEVKEIVRLLLGKDVSPGILAGSLKEVEIRLEER